MSLLLVPADIWRYFADIDTAQMKISAALFSGQYLLTAFARTTGIRFVQNVLAFLPLRKVSGSKPQVRKAVSAQQGLGN